MRSRHFLYLFLLPVIFAAGLLLNSCKEESPGDSKPDEYVRVFEANEDTVIKAIVQVFKDKKFGNAKIDYEKKQVETDYSIQDDWRSKSRARIKKINWKECEVTLSVITEEKTSSGWASRRLLDKKLYDNFFDAIELQIYNEVYKVK
jgi:hypothetical protein